MNLDLTREGLRRAADRAADLFTQIYCELEQRDVSPSTSLEQMSELFAGSIDENGVGLEFALNDFSEKILPFSMGTAHPLYFGLVNSSPLPAGPIADFLLSSLNNNGGSFHQSPAISALENEVVREFAVLCDLESGGLESGGLESGDLESEVSGMIVPGGTFANLQGLLLARQAHFPTWRTEGPMSIQRQPRLYRSDVTHFCIDRAAEVIGIGRPGIVDVPTVGRGEINLAELDRQIQQDLLDGHHPFAVVASAGTTGTGAMDDLDGVADLCQQYGLWMHVDACYGGGALLVQPRLKPLVGIRRADSVAIDPHKWFFIPMTAGLLLTKHRDLELETFDVDAPYIPSDGTVDPFRRGLPTSRRGSGLTVWMTLRAHGWNAIRKAVLRNIRLIRMLEGLLSEAGFNVMPHGKLSVACARWQPDGMSSSELDGLQTRIAHTVVESGRAWFSTVRHQQLTWLRLNLVNLHTREDHVRELAALMTEAARQCDS